MTTEEYKLWSLLGTWVASLGTVGAVITALFLAGREKRIKLSVGAGHRIILRLGTNPNPPEYCSIYVTNTGIRKANIVSIGWKIGYEKPRTFIQTPDFNPQSSQLPVELGDGQEARYMIPLKDHTGNNDWLNQFLPYFGRRPELDIRSMKVQVYTSIGKVFESKIERGLADNILDYVNSKREDTE